ncbi:hypothetical protein GALMADRAFT_1295327 [Galerina marginata CBS 339.88]|uniref:Uncharacterized protein n=1 Tax=Galerina marginata (strain CBS 339.88) TaxID=685588 RepID=A0A067T6L9_GALM3|nr:hypothetical protein GALMADRAFT_1295327 [Galerina marginata CBS 339.88]
MAQAHPVPPADPPDPASTSSSSGSPTGQTTRQLLLPLTLTAPDLAQYQRDPSGDLDWTYTASSVPRLSPSALLARLHTAAFSIPPRSYSPAAPVVYVQLANGDVISLLHGYRLPGGEMSDV